MRFYPKLDLFAAYYRHLPQSDWFSNRIPDRTVKNSVDNINRAANICEQNDTFLDFGAGNGRYCAALLSLFSRGYGIEIEADAYLATLAKQNKNFTAIFGKTGITKVKDKIDLILLMDVIEHIPIDSVDDLVKSLSKLQTKGGVIHLSTPNPIRCGTVSRSGIYYKRFKFGHRKHYLPSELIALFTKYGYVSEILCYEDFPLRRFVKLFFLGAALIDKKLGRLPLYNWLSYPCIQFFNFCTLPVQSLVSFDEFSRRNDNFSSQTILLTLKKR